MALVGTIAIYSDNTMKVRTGAEGEGPWVPYSSLTKLFLGATAARDAMGQTLESPEIVSLAARIMATAQKRK